MAPLRKSGRQKKATSKASEALNLSEYFGTPPPAPASDDKLDDIEFNAEQISQGDDGDDDDLSNDGIAAEDDRGPSESAVEANEDDVPDVLSDDNAPGTPGKRSPWKTNVAGMGPFRQQKKDASDESKTVRNRGVVLDIPGMSKQRALRMITGDTQQVNTVFEMVHRYYPQLALPSRHMSDSKDGGMSYTCFQTQESRDRDASEAWLWYFKGLGQWAFRHLQQSKPLAEHDAGSYRPNEALRHVISAGPLEPQLFTLHANHGVCFADLYESVPLCEQWTITEPRRGWLLNIGDSVKCLDWAPNQRTENQYLAISTVYQTTLGESPQGQQRKDGPKTSAFVPGEPSPSSFQVWRLLGRSAGDSGELTIDNSKRPVPVLTLCGNWGEITQLKWCPMACSPVFETITADAEDVGLLAIVSKDGCLRVLDVRCPRSGGSHSQYEKIEKCAFEARPPDTVCTCVAWISTTLIAAGCANGSVAIWDLERYFATTSPVQNPFPDFYCVLHTTYILAITTCYPSHPHMIITTAMDGHVRLTDIRDPYTDSATTLRNRTPRASLDWSDRCSTLFCGDDTGWIKYVRLRAFENWTSFMRCSASPTCTATSPVHASILVGGSDGQVYCTNTLRRLYTKSNNPCYRQIWFHNEWRRERPKQVERSDSSSAANGTTEASADTEALDFPGGLTRLTSGFRTEELPDNQPSYYRPKKGKKAPPKSDFGYSIDLYERESSIMTLVWNPNMQAGGWAAAGMGNGLVMVEDLCVD